MPAISLVVCVHLQRDLLERLIRKSEGCYDDLIVIHDGPDTTNIRAIVETAGGRFFERPRTFEQGPHWPFAWQQAAHDWILKLDADEFPSDEMKRWLQEFRRAPGPPSGISGYTCIWPLWNGKRMVSKKWPAGRDFLFNRQRVRFFGIAEFGIVSDGKREPLNFILCHQPKRKTHGLRNVLLRKQAYRWCEAIARSLLNKPTDLPCWRWTDEKWPPQWELVRRHPLQAAVQRLVMETFRGLRSQWRAEKKIYFRTALTSPIHQALICFEFWRLRHGQAKNRRS